jgi:regulator of protease activity HflC (stomatin/prohibitin superfamily)
VPDSTGAPMNINTMINFVITDPVASKFAVKNLRGFIETQATDIVRKTCGAFRYRSNDKNEVSLLSDGHFINAHMQKMLDRRVKVCGVKILRVSFFDLSYSREVATSLLQVQQAQARIDARKIIVEGATSITSDACKNLKAAGIHLSEDDQS